MNIVVTGAAGFIGSHTVERLIADGHEVTGIDSFDGYLYPSEIKREVAARLQELPGFRLVEGDICDPNVVAQAIAPQVDVVCHLAALAGVRPSLAEPQRYLRTNILGTGVIVERMRRVGLTRLVFASSSSVYGAKASLKDQPVAAFEESDPCLSPASPYAATKRMNEIQLSTYRDLFDLGVFALRFFTVYGPRQRPDMAISKFLHSIARDERIILFGDGTSRRDYTFIDDIIAGVVAAIERVVTGAFQVFNLGNTNTIALRDLVGVIEQVVGNAARIDWQPMQPGDVPITFANIDRARSALDYSPKTRLEDGIAAQWAWLRQCRPIP